MCICIPVHAYMQDIPTLGFGINWGGVEGEVDENGLGDLTGLRALRPG